MEGIDFAGKTGTAQVVGGGDTHTKGGAKTPNSWFVGMVPRRNPEIVIAVLQEHGDWGSLSAHIAAQIVTAYVNKTAAEDKNVLDQAGVSKPVEVGAVWSEPCARPPQQAQWQDAGSGPPRRPDAFLLVSGTDAAAPKAVAAGWFPLPAWLLAHRRCASRQRQP